jgi:hypothetical protein
MFIELWERLRGYDKWVQTEAKIESSQVRRQPVDEPFYAMKATGSGYENVVGDVITWVDDRGEHQYATFDVTQDSKLSQLLDGDSVKIRYDPAQPDRFYYRDLLRYQVSVAVWSAFSAIIVAPVFILVIWAITQHR